MEKNYEQLFDELIQASRVLVTVAKNAATVLSEEFESMVLGPARNVEAILDQCPEGGITWDGTFSEKDVEENEFPVGVEGMKGMRLSHKQSEKKVEMSYPSADSVERVAATRKIAMEALKGAVVNYVKRQREIGSL